MNFAKYLKEQLEKHPSARPRDVVKMCYQGAHGAEHLLRDTDGAWAYLREEYYRTEAMEGELYEQISDNVCRVNLAPWKERGLPAEWLFRMFAASCRVDEEGEKRFVSYLEQVEELLPTLNVGFTSKEWEEYISAYREKGMGAVRHSEDYRKKERPAYRIVNSAFCQSLPILEKAVAYYRVKEPCVIVIDGRAASGKTTLAGILQRVLDADLVRMDDFFLPPDLRVAERFKTPGANVHHERFCAEVLPFIRENKAFSYRVFDCGIMDYKGTRQIGTKPFRIVEGSYSCHPLFGNYGDITVFSDVTRDEQRERIRRRNGEEMLGAFLTRWIPMEEEYFACYGIAERVDLKYRSE